MLHEPPARRAPPSGSALLLALLLAPPAATGEPSPPLAPPLALAYFEEAEALSQHDDGRLWGRPLYGPMLFVDPATRSLIANQADREGLLAAEDGVFVGRLPEEANVANTATDWAGVRWTMLLWPLPEEETDRGRLMMHESFHRIQDELGLPATNPGNDHLDSADGRLWLQLEWRALRAAVLDETNRRAAAADALLFRSWRRALRPESAAGEIALELNEGLAEYTGLAASSASPEALRDAVAATLERAPTRPSFVRSFAYASGPAYGLLLDAAAPGWRRGLEPETDLGELLRERLDITLTTPAGAELGERAELYGGPELEQQEAERETERRERLAAHRARFVDGPVLVLPMAGETNFSFNPNELVPLQGLGTVYTTLRVTDVWGILEVTDGALMSFETGEIRLEAPPGPAEGRLAGPGWTLELEPGWGVAPSERPGDFRLRATQAHGNGDPGGQAPE